jgi:hypothetical protein
MRNVLAARMIIADAPFEGANKCLAASQGGGTPMGSDRELDP